MEAYLIKQTLKSISPTASTSVAWRAGTLIYAKNKETNKSQILETILTVIPIVCESQVFQNFSMIFFFFKPALNKYFSSSHSSAHLPFPYPSQFKSHYLFSIFLDGTNLFTNRWSLFLFLCSVCCLQQELASLMKRFLLKLCIFFLVEHKCIKTCAKGSKLLTSLCIWCFIILIILIYCFFSLLNGMSQKGDSAQWFSHDKQVWS